VADPPTPTRWDASIFVAAPRPDVYAYLADPVNRPAWQRTLRRVQVLDPGEPHVGMRWVDHVAIGPPFHLRITGMVLDRVWAEEGRAGPFTAYGTLLFADERWRGVDGTRVRLVARVRGHGLTRPLGWAATAVAAVLVRDDLRRAARLLSAPTRRL
jgi:hypothetical protein